MSATPWKKGYIAPSVPTAPRGPGRPPEPGMTAKAQAARRADLLTRLKLVTEQDIRILMGWTEDEWDARRPDEKVLAYTVVRDSSDSIGHTCLYREEDVRRWIFQ